MANIRNPQYGVEKDELTLTSQDPASVLYGVNANNRFIPVKVGLDGSLAIGAVSLDMSDVQIGAVEVKNASSDDRLTITSGGEALTQARLYDSAGTAFTATTVGPSHALDINVVGGTTLSASTDEDDSVPAGMELAALINLTYGYDGVDWQRINATGGSLDVNITGGAASGPTDTDDDSLAGGQSAALALGLNYGWAGSDWERLTSSSGSLNVNITGGSSSGPTDTDDGSVAGGQLSTLGIGLQYGWNGATWERVNSSSNRLLVDGSGVTQPVSGTITANVGTTGGLLLDTTFTGRINTLGQKTSANSTPVVLSSDQSSIPVTQSGAWSVGRTWTLASGTDSVAAVQSGTWNINNISGTISLPTGAATETTLSSFRTDFNAVDFATETTLALIQSQTDQLTFAATRLLVDGSGVTQPISAVSLPLPTGAATQATLLAVETNTDNLDVALSTRLADATFTGRINTLGQKLMAASTPVVLASDQSSIPVTDAGGSLTVDGTIAATQSGAWSVSVSNFPALQSVAISQVGTDNDVDANITNTDLDVNLRDGAGNAISSTAGALDVNIAGGVTLDVNLDNANDDVLVYGNDGSTNRVIRTDANGELQVDVLTLPSDIDVRDLDSAQDSVEVLQATHDNLNLNANLQVGNTDVANGNPVPISDAGGSITVDGTVAVSNFPSVQTVAISQTGTDNDVDVTDEVTRELGRVLASDALYDNEDFSTTSTTYAQARPVEGDFNFRHYKTKKILIKNNGANAGRINVFGSIDDGATFDVVIVNNVALASGNTSITDLQDAVTHVRVEGRAQNAGQEAIISSKAYALGV